MIGGFMGAGTPPRLIGAMDLVAGARRVIVAMTHTAKGERKIVKHCTLPLTGLRRVDLVVTELAVIAPTEDGLVLKEVAPGVTIARVMELTDADLIVAGDVPTMPIE